MGSTSRIWRIAGFFSALSTLLLLGGFLFAVVDITNPKALNGTGTVAPPREERPAKLVNWDLTAIGDSLAKGTGDDTGKGFARRTVELLKQQGVSSTMINNLGINGLTTEKLLKSLNDQGVRNAIGQSGIVLLSIGGNDLFNGTEHLLSGERLPTPEELDDTIDKSSVFFRQAVDRLHEINPQAALVYVSLYNPFSDLEEMREIGDNATMRWNEMVQKTLAEYEGTLVVPTYDLFTQNAARYLSGDHFHPNGDGYQAIAVRIVQSIGRK
ncbi:GDSL-type esterase/lipase family protein [Paenibacillus sp. DYY-L-2]|uniref:GDSL-type esterase/lipase family protein n=1 Tax=Paenibacillus sp. DYY-L-2 TaxID=3447013 RepID=UPI003F502DBB